MLPRAPTTRDVSPELWRRYLTVLLDDLRVRRDAPSELPVAALGIDQIDAAMRACQ